MVTGAGVKLLHRLRHDVGSIVANQLQRFLALRGDDGDLRVAVDDVHHHATLALDAVETEYALSCPEGQGTSPCLASKVRSRTPW